MESRQYPQIQYDPNNLENAEVTEVTEIKDPIERKIVAPVSEILAEEVKAMVENNAPEEQEQVLDAVQTTNEDAFIHTEESKMDAKEETHTEPETDQTESSGQIDIEMESEACAEKPAETNQAQETVDVERPNTDKSIEEIREDIEYIYHTMRRLESKFETEILNAQSKEAMVKTMYQELNDYKAGLVEKALKNVLYDIVDIREMMFAKAKYVRQKKGTDVISLEEFESYAEDIGDILERYDVTIYKGESGVENTAVRQKIVRKVETADASLVKKVAESLSFGYEYNRKILYPERISIFVEKKTEQNQ